MKDFILRQGNVLCEKDSKDDEFSSNFYKRNSGFIKEKLYSPDEDSEDFDPLVKTPETKSNTPTRFELEEEQDESPLTDNFDGPFYDHSLSFLYNLAKPYFIDSSFLCMTLTVNLVTTIILFSTIKALSNSSQVASFGLAISFFQFIFGDLSESAFEVSGLQCCKAYAAKNWKMLNTYLLQGLTFQALVAALVFALFYYSEPIMSYFGIHEVHAREAGYMLRYCIPGMILQCFNDQLKSYLVTLKCAVPFGMINIYNIILNITLSYYLVIQCNMPLLAFPVIKVVNEVNIALLSIYLFTFKIKPEVKVMPCWSIYKDNLQEYFKISAKVIAGFYSESIGFIICTHMIGITQRNSEIAAYTQWTSISAMFNSASDSFGFINRINVAYLLAKKKSKDAKYLAWYCVLIVAIVGGFLSISFVTLNHYIATFYTNIDRIYVIFRDIIYMYGFFQVIEMVNSGLSSLMRLHNKITTVGINLVGFNVIIQSSLGYYLCHICNLKARGLVLAYGIAVTGLTLTNLYQQWHSDWDAITAYKYIDEDEKMSKKTENDKKNMSQVFQNDSNFTEYQNSEIMSPGGKNLLSKSLLVSAN